ncbi:TPA_asm: hypothetical protein PROPHIFSIL01-1_44 [Mycobacterium phage prophiFSIL01-1]|nr:TPA_asm: hypothetical protein PROPHIFSIL01-1_44 [Mycobacterium phage prophiFSIL01-1]
MSGAPSTTRQHNVHYTSYHEQLTDPSQNPVQAFRRRRF